MELLIKTLDKLHIGLKFTAFLSLVLLAGLSLRALTPVGYEDYSRAMAVNTQLQLAKDAQTTGGNADGKVAGITTNTGNLSVTNLLEGKGMDYSFSKVDNSANIKVIVSDKLNQDLAVLNFTNTSDSYKSYSIVTIQKDPFRFFLTSRGEKFWFDSAYTVNLNPGETVTVGISPKSESTSKFIFLYQVGIALAEVRKAEIKELAR